MAQRMVQPNARVVEMVNAEVVRDPGATTQELFDLAVLLDGAISNLKPDEFAEIYEQPARARTRTPTRRKAAAKPRKTARKRRSRPAAADPTPAPPVDDRVLRHIAVRRELERFAVDLVSAETDAKRLVAVMADLDRYVARVMKALES